jgi:predicted transcriptional regulator
MSVQERSERARELRAQGKVLAEIATELGVSTTTAWRYLSDENAEKDRAGSKSWKDRNRVANRRRDVQRERERKARGAYGACTSCGDGLAEGNVGGTCARCVSEAAAKRLTEAVALWCDGLSMREIGERVGLAPRALTVRFVDLRRVGVPIPRRHKGTLEWRDELPSKPIVITPGQMAQAHRG